MDGYSNAALDLLRYQLFPLGQSYVTPLGLITFAALMIVLIYVSGKLRTVLVNYLLIRTPLQQSARVAIGTLTRYLVLFVGFIIILQTLGIDLTAFNVLAGAIGIGIGLGLQNVANNFIAGLIILFERPIKVGDRVEVGDATGEVETIGPRSTRIRTNDNITIIVPNSNFITENVINWSYAASSVRFKIPVVVSLNADLDLVDRLMCEAAEESAYVDKTPEPITRLMSIEPDGMHFELRAWTTSQLGKPAALKSDLLFTIVKKFRENGIEFGDSGLMEIKMDETLQAAATRA
jgi:small-conductance mechanosensitive channel